MEKCFGGTIPGGRGCSGAKTIRGQPEDDQEQEQEDHRGQAT